MEEKIFELPDKDQNNIYIKLVVSFFKTFVDQGIITPDEYELLSQEVYRTFNIA